MQTLAVIALVIGMVMLFRWLGPPVRHRSEEKKSKDKALRQISRRLPRSSN